MKYTSYLILLFFFLYSCSANNEAGSETEESAEETLITDIETLLNDNPNIKIGKAEFRNVKHDIACTGRIELPPDEMISVHSKSNGYIENIPHIAGDYVRKGEKLLDYTNIELIEKQRILLESKAH